MFRNWRSIFNGDGGPMDARIPIYSFDGRDVLADPFWSVDSIDLLPYLLVCRFLFVNPSLPVSRQASEEHLARHHRPGRPSGGQALRDVASGPRVRRRPVVQPDLGSAPGPADEELLQPVHRALHREPEEPLKNKQQQNTASSMAATRDVQHSGRTNICANVEHFCVDNAIFSLFLELNTTSLLRTRRDVMLTLTPQRETWSWLFGV